MQYKSYATIFLLHIWSFNFFTLSCFAPITSPVMSIKGHITCQGGSVWQGSWSMLHNPSTPNMPKTCMAWTQIMSRNANGAFHLGPWALPSGQRMRASPTSERLPGGNWGRLTQHNYSCSLLEQDLPCKLPRAGHMVIWTVRSPHWFWRGRHIRRLSPWTLSFAFSSQDDVLTNLWEVS